MMRILCLGVVALTLSACAADPMPDPYRGPSATIVDSVQPGGADSADFFYLSDVNGQAVDNSLVDTASTNAGLTFDVKPVVTSRDVPTDPATFTIVGRTHYGAPVLEFVNPVYEVSGDIRFTPVPEKTYVVKGVLGENYSAIWIEDKATGAVVGRKIELHGSAELGIF
jgi:hypothetical protein